MSAVNPRELLAADLEADETIVVARRPFTIGAPPPGPGAEVEPAVEPAAVSEGDEFDETIVVSRVPSGAAPADPHLDADETIVVQRTGPAPAAAAAADADETIVVQRTGPAPAAPDAADQTVVVERTVVRATPLPTDAPDGVMNAPTRRGRRVAPAPVSEDVLSTAEVGRGPGLLEHYAARPIEVAAPPLRTFAGGADPTRDPAQALPSVARRSRRSALVVLAAFGSSCVLAVIGLAVVVVLAFAG
ncbi:hypothetical protein [Agromyces sp. Leaf222]|uniref:hypothetical protein n=1 Tax=Agromyces sp. Leaf222 TaxID=1735688 RepID=UPI0006F86567|nr:hypothetical protein [Agromyces sp. Leaf222]KQM82145.1 hypothetical protein ASE68_01560 [Agromyces sp. Leaf222]